MATIISLSVRWRKQGNSHFSSAVENLAPVVRIMRYHKALACYESAHSTGNNDDEISSAAKNAGIVSWKLAKLAVVAGEHWPVVKRYFKQSLKYFNHAYTAGTNCNKAEEWLDNILARCRGCWEDVGSVTDDLPDTDQKDRILTIRECIDYIPCVDMKADCYLEIAEYHFHRGLKAVALNDYKTCLNNMRECHFPLAEAIKHGRFIDRICQEHATMETDVYMQTAVAESLQSMEIGDRLLEKILLDEETLSIDMVWEVIDWYKHAIIKAREFDMKLEAIALSKIGAVYDKVFKIKFRARIYLKKSLELAQSLRPMNFTTEIWYKDCVTTLDLYQRETVQHEQEKHQKEREEVKKKLQPDLDKLEKHRADSNMDFLKFVYGKYPPKNPNHRLSETDVADVEQHYKLLQQAVIHFHPDRVRVEEDGLEVKVLNEEITKLLTCRYETVKSVK